MSIACVKKILFAGTALVAASAFSLKAQAATIDITQTESESAPFTEAPQAAGNPGTAGDVGYTFTASSTSTPPITLTLQSSATVTGQTGASGSASGAIPQVGGIGVFFNSETGVAGEPLSLVNDAGGTGITGGAGGNAYSSASAASATQAGANGSQGVNMGLSPGAGYTRLTGTGNITGGAGGIGSFGNGASTAGGAGGNALGGVRVSGTNDIVNDSGVISGGTGGAGGSPTGTASIGGVGGIGGNGINIDSNSAVATVTITADVNGGAGGNGGTGTIVPNAAVGGVGGNGIVISGATETVTITGAATTVSGGAGGNSILGSNGTAALAVTGAAGGIGLDVTAGSGDIITNAGIIKGGIGGVGITNGLSGVAVNIGSAVATLTNTGTIGSATTENNNALVLGGAVTTFSNTGNVFNDSATNATMLVTAAQTASITSGADIVNSNASITATALSFTTAAQTDAFINSGTLEAVGTGSAAAPTGIAVNLGYAGNLAFENTGSVLGNIVDGGVAANATITNAGTMLGNIVLTGSGTESITLTSGTLTGVGSSTAAIDMHTGSGNDTVSQAGGTVTGTSLGALLFGTGTNSFTQTGGTLSSLGGSTTNIAMTGGGGVTTLTLGGGSIIGVTDLGAGANVINVNGTFSTDGAFLATGGSIALTSETGGVLNVNNAITTGIGAVATSGSGIINVDTSGSITNSSGGITTAGTGALRLVGGNVVTTGALTNNASVTINTGSTLTAATQAAGTGTFNFSVTGSNAGTMTSGLLNLTAGNLTMTGSTIKALVASGNINTGAVTEIAAGTGPATLPNGTQSTTAVAISSGSDLYTFQYALGNNPAVLLATSSTSNADEIYLIATRTALSEFGSSLTPNDLSVNNALQAFGNEGVSSTAGERLLSTIEGKIAAATTAATLHSDLQSLTPTIDGGAQMIVQSIVAETQGIADTRMSSLRDGDTTTGVAAGASANGVSMWYEGYGQHANQSAMDNINGYAANTWGGAVGVDSAALMDDGGIFGMAFNFGRSAIDSNNANTTTTDMDSYGLNFYGSFDLGQMMFINGQAGYSYNSITSERHNADLAGNTAEGDTYSNQYSAKMTLGRDYPVGGIMTLTPDVSTAYTNLNTHSYTETGAGGADNFVSGNSLSILDLGVGGTAAWKMRDADGDTLKPSLHTSYAYDVIGDRIQTISSFTGDPASTIFTTEGASPARSLFDAGAKIIYTTKGNWDFSANYDFQLKQDYTSNSGELRATTYF